MRIVHDRFFRFLLFGASALTAVTALLPGAAVPAAAATAAPATAAHQPATPFAGQAYLAADLASVSCGSTTNCVAVGTQTVSQEPVQNAVADIWNGTKWSFDSELPANGNPADLNTVSCAGTFCMSAGVASNDTARASIAVGDKFDATSQTWTDVSPSLGGICAEFQSCAWAGVLACGSSASCIRLAGCGPASSGTALTGRLQSRYPRARGRGCKTRRAGGATASRSASRRSAG